MADACCNQILRSTLQTETLYGPGDFRVNQLPNGTTRLLLSQWPITTVTAIQVANAASMPYQWTPVQTGAWAVERPSLAAAGHVSRGGFRDRRPVGHHRPRLCGLAPRPRRVRHRDHLRLRLAPRRHHPGRQRRGRDPARRRLHRLGTVRPGRAGLQRGRPGQRRRPGSGHLPRLLGGHRARASSPCPPRSPTPTTLACW